MNVLELMTTAVKFCGPSDNLQNAAQIMWDNDCGVVPVVDADGSVVGMITDRDICMAAYTRGQPLWQIPVLVAMAKQVHSVRENDQLDAVELLMRRMRIRRVPVLDGDGRLKGILSMNDLARRALPSKGRKADGLSTDSIVQTLGAICEPNIASKAKDSTTNGNRAHLSA
jgi:CBS domain-containing protein